MTTAKDGRSGNNTNRGQELDARVERLLRKLTDVVQIVFKPGLRESGDSRVFWIATDCRVYSTQQEAINADKNKAVYMLEVRKVEGGGGDGELILNLMLPRYGRINDIWATTSGVTQLSENLAREKLQSGQSLYVVDVYRAR